MSEAIIQVNKIYNSYEKSISSAGSFECGLCGHDEEMANFRFWSDVINHYKRFHQDYYHMLLLTGEVVVADYCGTKDRYDLVTIELVNSNTGWSRIRN